MRNDRTGRGKYQSKTHSSLGLWSCCFKAPRLLSSCQLIKATSQPIPVGIPHQTARGAFYPKQNTASCHSTRSATSRTRMAKFNTAEWKSIPLPSWRTSDTSGGNGEKVTRKMKSWKTKVVRNRGTRRGSQMKPSCSLMSQFTLLTPKNPLELKALLKGVWHRAGKISQVKLRKKRLLNKKGER